MSATNFGKWLQHLRKKAGLTQRALAQHIICSTSALRKYESGERRPPAEQIERLIEQLSIDPSEQETFRKLARAPLSAAPTPPTDMRPARYPGALPIPPGPLIGRDQLMTRVRDRLRLPATRLLTLTGAPGIGKTRLALEVASQLRYAFADDVCYLTLAPLSNAHLVIPAITQALGAAQPAPHDPVELLVQSLQERQVLLVIDNCEHVLEAACDLARVIARCPFVKVLATSRTALNLRSERRVSVPPLELPPETPDVATVKRAAAVQFFVDRAAAVVDDFVLSAANAAEVATICRQLDGIPLAIELVAARCADERLPKLLQQLDRRLVLLTDGPRDLEAHQQTLRSTLAWSYDRLPAAEQQLFARLGVFTGGAAPAAIAYVARNTVAVPAPDAAVLDSTLDPALRQALGHLIDSNLVQAEPRVDETISRIVMLETLREYALEQLALRGDLASVRDRHAVYYHALALRVEPDIRGPQQVQLMDTLEQEHTNIRAALAWSAQAQKHQLALETAGAIWWFWYTRAHIHEGRTCLRAMLDATQDWRRQLLAGQIDSDDQSVRAQASRHMKALHGAGVLAHIQGDSTEAQTWLSESLAISRQLNDLASIAAAVTNLGAIALRNQAYAQARALYEEGLAVRRSMGDHHGIAFNLNNLGIIAHEQCDYERASQLYTESAAIKRQFNDRRGLAMTLINHGIVARVQGDLEAARVMGQEGLEICQELADQWGITGALTNLAAVDRLCGDYDAALTRYAGAIDLARKQENRWIIIECLEGIAGVDAARGNAPRAARLLGAAHAARGRMGAPLPLPEKDDYNQMFEMARAQMPNAEWERRWAEGQALSLDAAIRLVDDDGSLPPV
ncbi:MAG: tetratricopeptide repeat protein [Chloroflexales bacterium]|nr:tetratricopeptide repeat protein [Chloroflexales bacterium]